jgi:hypothetical protein
MQNYMYLLNEWWYVLILIGVMFVSGCVKRYNLFIPVYNYLIKRVKNQKVLVALLSFIGGILPIPGRVIISAGLLDTIAPDDPKKRSKFGIIDYLATHHYYLWSIMETTILIPMAVLSISYWEVMRHLWPLLLGTIAFLILYINTLKNEDIHNFTIPNTIDTTPWHKFIKWNIIIYLMGIIIFGNYIKHYGDCVKAYIQIFANNGAYFSIISLISFLASFILGSSSKFVGIATLLTSIFGIHYFTYFFALEYIGYLLSPSHKCVYIGMSYFRTPLWDYYKVLILWSILLFSIGLLSLI